MTSPRTKAAPHAKDDDAARAVRFLILKAAVFIGVPVVASIVAVLVLLK